MRLSLLRRLTILAMVPAVLLGIAAVASPASAAAAPWQTLQSDVVRWTNHERAKAGCRPVRVDARLVRAGRDHSAWMSRTGKFSHVGRSGSTFAGRGRAAGYTAPLSENLAWGYRSGTATVNAWMRSTGHRANLLNCAAKAVGVGVVYAADGTPYYTQIFGTR